MNSIAPEPLTSASRTAETRLAELRPHLTPISQRLSEIARLIHGRPEVGFTETFASGLLAEELEHHGFTVERAAAGLDTAFVAYAGSDIPNSPTIGIFCEFDALKGLGHACGHNLIAAAGLGAAIITKKWLEEHPDTPARIRVLGSPAEEEGGGKVYLERAGHLAGLDAAMMIHPGGMNQAWFNSLSHAVLSVSFRGKAAHAAAFPFDGVNALDAATLTLTAIGLLRQQLLPDSRVHGIVTDGGTAPNIIPDRTSMLFQVRSPSTKYLNERLLPAVRACINGAALATGAVAEITEPVPVYEGMTNNPVLARLCETTMTALGLDMEPGPPDYFLGSTDMGNVSQRVPSVHPHLMLRPGLTMHTAEAALAAGSADADALIAHGTLLLAATAVELVDNPELLTAVQQSFTGQQTNHKPRAIILSPSTDNVAVALTDLAAGEIIELDSTTAHITEPIPAGHKFTTCALNGQAAVVKRGETIGHATQAIPAGAHVHVHNVTTARLAEPCSYSCR